VLELFAGATNTPTLQEQTVSDARHYVAGCRQSQELEFSDNLVLGQPGVEYWNRREGTLVKVIGPKFDCVDDPCDVTCRNCLAKIEKSGRYGVTFSNVRKGWLIVDQYGQMCRVEHVTRRKSNRRIVTRRRDETGWWTEAATWSPSQFDRRTWRRTK
jgi:hypothetical protein